MYPDNLDLDKLTRLDKVIYKDIKQSRDSLGFMDPDSDEEKEQNEEEGSEKNVDDSDTGSTATRRLMKNHEIRHLRPPFHICSFPSYISTDAIASPISIDLRVEHWNLAV
ncbi:hypothetical protein PM082_008490 [Marasmius tenuissimus]|nr:hypothetical protein PM082_008490 [Marasmius tenuissimus]